jgi:subtilase family serine protease
MKAVARARGLVGILAVATCLSAAVATTAAASTSHSLMSHATDLGRVKADSPIEITLWLKLHDEAGLDALVAAQQAGKGDYLTLEQLRAKHGPTAADAAKVAAFLTAQGFTAQVGDGNLYVRASGTVGRVESAFKVELHQYNLFGRTFRANSDSAKLPTELQPLVSAVAGLSTLGAEPAIARIGVKRAFSQAHRASDAEGLPARGAPLGSAGSAGLAFSAQCFYPPTSETFSGGTTTATYQGNVYGAPIGNAQPNLAPCGYQPSDLQTAFNLNPLYARGLTGAGTTIAIVDAYGSTTIANDVAAFSANMGLPPANLTIIGTPTESNFSTDANAGWAAETTLDVEWVHAIAPGAKIVLVITPTNQFTDLFAGDATAAAVPGVVAISNSWSGFDIGVAGNNEFYSTADSQLKSTIAMGIAVNYALGDNGDNSDQLSGLYTSTGWPGSSPYATAIGGTSVVLNSHKQLAWQTSWGTNLTEIADTNTLGNPPIDVPNNEGFVFGGTGGYSDTYPKPFWQVGVPGNRRGTPDISWIADPYTGVEIIYTADAAGDLTISTIGGTSLACPTFTALWGIATQRAGHKLGQAAPRLYRLPAWTGAISDVTNLTSANNVTGTITDATGTDPIRASELAAPLYNLPSFVSALYQSPYSTRWFVITFGLDTTLAVGPGWDTATGLGAPNNAWAFVQAVAAE